MKPFSRTLRVVGFFGGSLGGLRCHSVFVAELGLELELEVEWEKASEKESEKHLRMLDENCSWGRICVGSCSYVVFYVVSKKLYESRQHSS